MQHCLVTATERPSASFALGLAEEGKQGGCTTSQQQNTVKINQSRRQIIKMLLVIIIVFTACWCPRYGTTALLQKIFFTESFRYFPQILSNIFFVQVPDSHDRVGGAYPGLGVQCHPTILLLLTYCKAPSRHTRNAQSYYLQVTCVNICRQY